MEQARPLVEKNAIKELADPRMKNCYPEKEMYCMVHCASLCIRRDPHSRPRMSQVGPYSLNSSVKTNSIYEQCTCIP